MVHAEPTQETVETVLGSTRQHDIIQDRERVRNWTWLRTDLNRRIRATVEVLKTLFYALKLQ
jgi:hypothetical protein